MTEFKGGIASLRTNLAVLAVSASSVLTGVLIVCYGGARLLPLHPILQTWYWLPLVAALGVGGVLLFIAKGVIRPHWLRWLLGASALLPSLVGGLIASPYLTAPILAFAVPAFFCAGLSIAINEPDGEKTNRHLVRFFASSVCLLLLPVTLLIGSYPSKLPDQALLSGLFLIGAAAAWLHVRHPSLLPDRLAGFLLGAAFVVRGFASVGRMETVESTLWFPTGLILLCLPFLRNYRLGTPDPVETMNEENRIVRQFEALSELVAWATFVFSFLYVFLRGAAIGTSGYLFAIFGVAYLAFIVQYRLLPPQRSTFASLNRRSTAYIALLAVACHVTGGLLSPYAWFFTFLLLTGSVVPNPRTILKRLALVLAYYALEIAYTYRLGALNHAVFVEGMLLPVFIIGLTGLYAYHLAARRRQIDSDLMQAYESYKQALVRETAARELVARQAAEIGLARKRDEALLSSLADGVFALDAKGAITMINPVAETFMGVPQSEAIGMRLRDLLMLRRENEAAFRLGPYIDTALKGGAVPLPEGLYQEKPDGQKVFYTGAALPVLDDGKRPNGAVLVLQDVTYLREVDQMKTSFLSVAAHQLRTPLSTIRWYLELLNDPSEGRLSRDQKTFAENAYVSLLRMVELINDLLAITRLEAGRVPFKPEPTSLKVLTADVLEGEKRRLVEQELKVSVDIPDDVPNVPLDPTLAREVFVNLVQNAIRYTPKGGTISIRVRDAGDELDWSIADSGIGIPKDQESKIFAKFFRASNAVDFNSEGSGLGLYLARFIVSNWGGNLSFTSREGKGATFNVTVPKTGMRAKPGQVSLNA